MEVLVAGGSGLVGRAVAQGLLDAGHAVRVMSRSRPPGVAAGKATWVPGDVTRPDTLGAPLEGVEVVIDAVQFPKSPIENPRKGYTFKDVDYQGTVNLADAAAKAKVGHYIDISGGGAAEDAPYHWQRYKWLEEQHIISTGICYTIFRPTWIFARDDVSLNRFLNLGRFLPFIPVIGNGRTRTNILFLDDLVAHIVATLTNERARFQTFDIGGPEVLSMDETIRTALDLSGQKRFLLHQPKALMKALAGVAQWLPGRPLTPDAIDFITMEVVADTTHLENAFGLRLTPLREGLATYLRPA